MDRLTEWKDDKKLLAKAKFSGDFGSQNILQSLAEYEDLEELIGIPLKNLAEICNNKIPEEFRNPKKAIVLTDKDADRWNEYKNAEEHGLLLRLPCKVGDTVYAIGFNNNKPIIYESVVLRILITEKEIVFNVKLDEFEINSQLKQSMFCKTVFITRAEAEQKLKEMEGV